MVTDSPGSGLGIYGLLALAWLLWCVSHSLLVHLPVKRALQRRLARRANWYRLLYNAVSVVTLAPVLVATWQLRQGWWFRWDAGWRWVQGGLLLLAVWLFWLGGRRYDLSQFVGLRQLRAERDEQGLTAHGGVDAGGVLGVVRHPWYLAGLLLLWGRDLSAADVVANGVMSAYLVVGGLLEERKLCRAFGDEYRGYQQRVSMLLPWKWVLARRGVWGSTGRGAAAAAGGRPTPTPPDSPAVPPWTTDAPRPPAASR